MGEIYNTEGLANAVKALTERLETAEENMRALASRCDGLYRQNQELKGRVDRMIIGGA